jgi:hypothetical protein
LTAKKICYNKTGKENIMTNPEERGWYQQEEMDFGGDPQPDLTDKLRELNRHRRFTKEEIANPATRLRLHLEALESQSD